MEILVCTEFTKIFILDMTKYNDKTKYFIRFLHDTYHSYECILVTYTDVSIF